MKLPQNESPVKPAVCEDCGHAGTDVSFRYRWNPSGGYHRAECDNPQLCLLRSGCWAPMNVVDYLARVAMDASHELGRARQKFPAFNSAHEGYAVILEELDELWEQVKKKKEDRSAGLLYMEAIQVAAMAMRFAHDICLEGGYPGRTEVQS